MKVTPRILLITGLLGSAAAAWGGFMLGDGARSSSVAPTSPPVAVKNRPAMADGAAVQAQPYQPPFSTEPSRTETLAAQPPSSFANSAKLVETSARGDAVQMANAAATTPTPRERVRMSRAEQTPPRYPLVMMEVPATTLNAQPGLAAAMNRLRDKFIADVGGTGQNPTDPAYQARWAQSMASVEEQLRSAVGWEAFNQLQATAYYAQKKAP